MAVQARLDQVNIPFYLEGTPFVAVAETILQDAARTVVLPQYTVMAQVAASRKWVPYYWVTTEPVDGTYLPLGVYVGDQITAAALAAADVVNCPILVGGSGLILDEGQLQWDLGSTGGGTALGPNTVLKAGNVASFTNWWSMTVRRFLEGRGLYLKSTIAISAAET